MKNYSLSLLFAVLILSASVVASAAEVSVTLSITKSELKTGEVPHFVIMVRAISSRVKVMKFAARSDLREAYARLSVLSNGQKVNVPIMISDPGPTDTSDYVELAAEQTLTFEHDGAPAVLSKLPAGVYSASVKLWPDWRSEPVESNSVSFRVR
jgi:hypothetical protein